MEGESKKEEKINWEIKLENEGKEEEINVNPTNENSQIINWDIKLEDPSSLSSDLSSPSSSISSRTSKNVAPKTLLDDPCFRRNFINDLKELECFLLQRRNGFFFNIFLSFFLMFLKK